MIQLVKYVPLYSYFQIYPFCCYILKHTKNPKQWICVVQGIEIIPLSYETFSLWMTKSSVYWHGSYSDAKKRLLGGKKFRLHPLPHWKRSSRSKRRQRGRGEGKRGGTQKNNIAAFSCCLSKLNSLRILNPSILAVGKYFTGENSSR